MYWLRRPAGHGPGQKPALLVVLHGTDDTAEQMLQFWSRLKPKLPILIAAPQGLGPGWRPEDISTITAMLDHLREHVPYDSERVLLAGFSAGGAMALHLLYKEHFPATAVAALANYVPPHLTVEQIRARRDVPVFYAVGLADVNQEKMRDGIDRLRAAGGDIELYRPRIEHKLDPQVAQAALDWLFQQCGKQITVAIDSATQEPVGGAALRLERIVPQARWHDPAQAEAARAMLDRLESSGSEDLAAARGLLRAGQPLAAVDKLLAVEAAYGSSRLGRQATDLRERTLADPDVLQQWIRRGERRRADEAFTKYKEAQRLVADRKLEEAADLCARIRSEYPDTVAAQRAGYLLDVLAKASKSP